MVASTNATYHSSHFAVFCHVFCSTKTFVTKSIFLQELFPFVKCFDLNVLQSFREWFTPCMGHDLVSSKTLWVTSVLFVVIDELWAGSLGFHFGCYRLATVYDCEVSYWKLGSFLTCANSWMNWINWLNGGKTTLCLSLFVFHCWCNPLLLKTCWKFVYDWIYSSGGVKVG